jgi:hypothetical protein
VDLTAFIVANIDVNVNVNVNVNINININTNFNGGINSVPQEYFVAAVNVSVSRARALPCRGIAVACVPDLLELLLSSRLYRPAEYRYS